MASQTVEQQTVHCGVGRMPDQVWDPTFSWMTEMYQGILVLWDLLTMVGLLVGLVAGGSLLLRE